MAYFEKETFECFVLRRQVILGFKRAIDQCACAAKALDPTLHSVPEMLSLFPRTDQRPICDNDRMA